MKKKEEIIKRVSKIFANLALKSGIASSNSACRFGYYQNEIPVELSKYKK